MKNTKKYQTAGRCADCGEGRVLVDVTPWTENRLVHTPIDHLREEVRAQRLLSQGREGLIDLLNEKLAAARADIARVKAASLEERERHEEEIRTLRNERNQQRRKATDAKEETGKLRLYISQLEKKNAMLSQEIDNLKQGRFDAPVLCECGCQRVVEQSGRGPVKRYYSAACRKRAERARRCVTNRHE